MTIGSRAARLATTTLFALLAACADAGPEDAGNAAATSAGDVAAGAADGQMLDPNTATREQILDVPGMDDATADALIDGRPYDDMLQVDSALAPTLEETEREAVYTHLWIPIDLNTASADEILLIPGVGQRMLHEFEEYRPYRAIEEFRREIGKYVDDEEVARLERYVTLR
ncbi:MAG: hypothetical protein ACRELV_06350 [Longimicrobiales bacterium]